MNKLASSKVKLSQNAANYGIFIVKVDPDNLSASHAMESTVSFVDHN